MYFSKYSSFAIIIFFVSYPLRCASNFQCSEVGRFLDPDDPICSNYYLCTTLPGGTFIKNRYRCKEGTKFDPVLQKCSSSYKCVKSLCSIQTDTFKCTQSGRFKKTDDKSCRTYYLCTALPENIYIKNIFSCPNGQFFDETTRNCSETYKCPCASYDLSTTVSPDPYVQRCSNSNFCSPTTLKESYALKRDTSNSSTVTNGFNRKNPNKELEVKSTILSTNSKTLTSMANPCFVSNPKAERFVCPEKGRFADINDETCTKYFLCNLLINGSFVKTEYSCPMGSWFDPNLGVCSIYYNCPCSATTTTETNRESSPTVLQNKSSLINTPTPSIPSTLTSGVCVANDTRIREFKCSARGRFFNPKDETCRRYFLCNLLRNGSFLQTEYTCPAGSWFDPSLQLCSIYYKCPCVTTFTTKLTPGQSSTASEETTLTELLTSTPSTICAARDDTAEDFMCSTKGRFPNPKDKTCTKYFLCNLLRNGSFLQTEYSCPDGSWFDPDLQICSIFYKCACIITEIRTSTEPENSLVTDKTVTTNFSTLLPISSIATSRICSATSSEEFKCSARGRFLNPQDETCTHYFLCNLLRNGSLLQTEYICPDGSWFDPDQQICTLFYQCPCFFTTTNNDTITTMSATSSYTCNSQDSAVSFVCPEKGRFLNRGDRTCTSYFLCSILQDGSLIRSLYFCPEGSYFDPNLGICSVDYKCPCLESTTPQITTTLSSNPCMSNSKENSFSCSKKGRFADESDVFCSSYFLCNLLRNGSFVQTKYYCPIGSYFDPSLHICSIYYKCSCQLS